MDYAIGGFPEPNAYPDFNSDKIVNFVDFAVFGFSCVKYKSCGFL